MKNSEDSQSHCVERKSDENLRSISSEDNRRMKNMTNDSTASKMKNVIVKNQGRILERRRQSSSEEARQKNEVAFEIWKRENTKAIRCIWREERQQELAVQQTEIERKRASHEAYLRWKKLLRGRDKLEESRRKAIEDKCTVTQERIDEKIAANEEAFKAWKKRKVNQSRQRYRQPRREKRKVRNFREFEFDSWLNQLDWVLHQKYVRERRYLVRSFYCQPTYYGTAALCMN